MAESRVPVGHHDLEREVIIDALLAVPPISSKGHWQSLLPCAHNNCERTNCTWANLLREAPGDVPSHIRGEADRTLFELTELTGDHWMRVIALPFSRSNAGPPAVCVSAAVRSNLRIPRRLCAI